MPRRSLRLKGLSPSEAGLGKRSNDDEELHAGNSIPKRQRRKAVERKPQRANNASEALTKNGSLPRTRELAIRGDSSKTIVIGVDEAGRGPLAGPVVAAAAYVPSDVDGICDSKKMTKEEDRERLFEVLIDSPDVCWAAAVMDAAYIDKVNILQATLHGMALATQAVMHMESGKEGEALVPLAHVETDMKYYDKACSSFEGCYVVTSEILKADAPKKKQRSKKKDLEDDELAFYALIDGNRMPKNMPCAAETITKGDGKEFAIGAASIIAKVIRDKLMREYHVEYPQFNLEQHKGYPTAAHMACITKLGYVPSIYRRTFSPLKTMEFDEKGKIVGTKQK